MIIAVTGTLGSGKSSVSRILSDSLQAKLLSADMLCKEEMQAGRAGFLAVEERWGSRFVESAEDGSGEKNGSKRFKRQAMREAVFADAGIRSELEAILHPLVYVRLQKEIIESREKKRWLIAEVPLLFEKEWTELFDSIVVVRVEEEQIFRRVARRDGRPVWEIERIVAAQMPQAEKVARANYVLDNSGIFSAVVVQCGWLAGQLHCAASGR